MAKFDPNPDLDDPFMDICDESQPIGDLIHTWKNQMEQKLNKANEHEMAYAAQYHREKPIEYTYEDLIPGTDPKRNLGALERFYNEGYRFYRPLMMWYLENGTIHQYLNAARTIYACDRDCPDFATLVTRSAQVAEQYPYMFVVAMFQYFNWMSYNNIPPVDIDLPRHPDLESFNEFLRQHIIQKKISTKFTIDYHLIRRSEEDDAVHEAAWEAFNLGLKEVLYQQYPHVHKAMFR